MKIDLYKRLLDIFPVGSVNRLVVWLEWCLHCFCCFVAGTTTLLSQADVISLYFQHCTSFFPFTSVFQYSRAIVGSPSDL